MSIAALAAHVVGIRAGAEVRQRTVALHAFDTLAVIAGGLATREGAAIARFFASSDGATRAAGLAAVARFTECDDIHVPSCMTAGSVAIPVALQFAETDEAFACAVEVAYATGIALAEAIGGVEALEHGVWPAVFAAPAVAAVACAVALQSDEKTIANAIALALAAASGRVGRPGGSPSGRWFLYGEATLKGIRAALAARQHFGGDLSLISEKWMAQQTAPSLVRMEPLNSPPHDAVSKVGLKPFVAARQGSNAIQAFLTLLEGGLRADEIERVEVALPAVALAVVSRPLDASIRLSTIANMGLQLGIAAFEPGRLLDIGREADFNARSIAFAKKVKVVAGAAPADGTYGWPATVRVYTANGVQEQHCVRLHGDPGDAALAHLVRSKLAQCDAAIRKLAGLDGPELNLPKAYERLKRIYAQLNTQNKIEQTAVTTG
jgi:2-methylcitrate dehydratase PrpD